MTRYYEGKITRKGQVTLPAAVRSRLLLKAGGRVRWIVNDDDVKLEPVGSVTERTYGVFKNSGPVLSDKELKEARAQAIADSVMERHRRSLEPEIAPTRLKRSAKTSAGR